ncbi:MAG: HD domain-containing protein [Clostridia bacterium]|nr:HD domain-containing protein [Clostridia bacterium]
MDLDMSKQEFLKYTSNYDWENFNIKRKVDHSLRVMKISENIAKSLNLSREEIDLATLIGLLHDIARFDQFTIYNTFNDSKSIDHGNYGVEILQKENYIRNYIKEDKYDQIIFTAIKNHNKFKIEKNLDEKELLFSKIIRDADKIDILYQGICISWKDNIKDVEQEKISEKEIQSFYEKRLVNRNTDLKYTSNEIRHLLTILGFVFDLNFKISYKILKESNYINSIINRFNFQDTDTQKNIEMVREIVNEYIDIKAEGDSK